MASDKYTQTMLNLPAEKLEMATSLSDQITDLVNTIRAERASIAEARKDSGIDASEALVESVKADLKPIAQQFRELVGVNWQDEDGYCNWSVAGESHKYETVTVDDGAARITALRGELVKLHDDKPLLVLIKGVDPVKLDDALIDTLTKLEPDSQALDILRQLRAEHQKMVEETNIRLEAMAAALEKIAGARKVTTTPPKLSVV